MARNADQIAQDHAAMLGSVSVINSVFGKNNNEAVESVPPL